jgi:hypothetical protein
MDTEYPWRRDCGVEAGFRNALGGKRFLEGEVINMNAWLAN